MVVYENSDFSGWHAEFTPGDHNMTEMMAAGYQMSGGNSVKVFSNGCPSTVDPDMCIREEYKVPEGEYSTGECKEDCDCEGARWCKMDENLCQNPPGHGICWDKGSECIAENDQGLANYTCTQLAGWCGTTNPN
jgi:hypothetical protein